MEAFATTSIVLLVGMAIPILFLLAAVVFDLGVGCYVLFRFWRDRWWPHMRHFGHAAGEPMRPAARGPMHSTAA